MASGQTTSRGAKWAVIVIDALILLAFVPSAIMKLTHNPMAVEGFTRMGIPPGALVPIGLLELFCVAVYLIPRTAVLGTFLLTGYLGGAILANIVNKSDFLHAVAIGLLVWAGAWLRVPELRTLIPVRKTREALGGRDPRMDAHGAADAKA